MKQDIHFERLRSMISRDTYDQFYPILKPMRDKLGSNFSKKMKIIGKILETHGEENLIDYFEKYHKTKSFKDKKFYTQGAKGVQQLFDTFSKRGGPKQPKTWRMTNYWIEKGYTEKQAKEKISELQSNIARKRTSKSYQNHSAKLKFSIDHWTEQGYTKEEAEILREPYLQDMLQDKEGFIRRYGSKEGRCRYKQRIQKLNDSLQASRHNRKFAGYVSKESLKFFIPLYKKCRRLGLSRDQIYLGVNGSREFFIRHPNTTENHGRFFDFCIPSLNLVIEYNGVFWHPRKRDEWKNPWMTYDDAMAIELEKIELCQTRDYELVHIWSDDDLNNRFNEICQLIKDRLEISNR